jgi:hypothetical protein
MNLIPYLINCSNSIAVYNYYGYMVYRIVSVVDAFNANSNCFFAVHARSTVIGILGSVVLVVFSSFDLAIELMHLIND